MAFERATHGQKPTKSFNVRVKVRLQIPPWRLLEHTIPSTPLSSQLSALDGHSLDGSVRC